MKEIKKNKKLCWNCDADVDKDSLYCLYCGMDLSKQKEVSSVAVAKEVSPEPSIPPEPSVQAFVQEEAIQKSSRGTLAALFLCAGSLLLLFTLFLLLFAQEGVLRLQWEASGWFLYAGLSVVCLYFGYRSLRSS